MTKFRINKLRLFLKKRWVGVVSLCTGLIIWQILAEFVVRDSFILPSCSAVILSLYKLVGEIPGDVLVSLWHFVLGLGFAMVVGILLGGIMGWFRVADRIIDPIIQIIRPIPPLAWIPFAIIWFGLTHHSAGFVIFIGAIFPILINTYAGFRDVPKRLVEAAKVLGCKKNFNLMKSVALPAALPSIITGIRIAMGIGWMCLVAAEIFGQTSGLGYKLWHFYQLHQIDQVVSYMIILGVMGLLLDRGFRYFIEKKILRWRIGLVA